MAQAVKPLGSKVLVQRLEAEQKTPGGIVLPDSAKEKPQQGRVVEVGPGSLNDNGERTPIAVNQGQTVLFTAYAGTEIMINREKFMIMDESDILAIIE
jgi:chaperonin GroES